MQQQLARVTGRSMAAYHEEWFEIVPRGYRLNPLKRDTVRPTPTTCLHQPCTCPTVADVEFCGPICSQGLDAPVPCECGHTDCLADLAAPGIVAEPAFGLMGRAG
jgi:hypothetical protein